MAIGGRSRLSLAVNDANPFEMTIDSAWQDLQAALAVGDGHRAASLLEQRRQGDRPVWNALHWRVDEWLQSWFVGRGLHTCDNFPNDDFRREALTAFLFRIYPNDPEAATLHSFKLPRILQELRVYGAQVSAERRGQPAPAAPVIPPQQVRQEVRSVVPGVLFDDDDDFEFGTQSNA